MFTEIDKIPFGKVPNIKAKPTLKEIKKEWKKRGFKVTQLNSDLLHIYNYGNRTVIEINKKYKNFRVFDSITQSWSVLSFENLKLVTETIEAWMV